jgi:hypothetical protein
MYLKWMLAHLKNIEWLCCYQGPVAYAHRQRSVALRAKTKQPYARFSRLTLSREDCPRFHATVGPYQDPMSAC